MPTCTELQRDLGSPKSRRKRAFLLDSALLSKAKVGQLRWQPIHRTWKKLRQLRSIGPQGPPAEASQARTRTGMARWGGPVGHGATCQLHHCAQRGPSVWGTRASLPHQAGARALATEARRPRWASDNLIPSMIPICRSALSRRPPKPPWSIATWSHHARLCQPCYTLCQPRHLKKPTSKAFRDPATRLLLPLQLCCLRSWSKQVAHISDPRPGGKGKKRLVFLGALGQVHLRS